MIMDGLPALQDDEWASLSAPPAPGYVGRP